VFGRHDRHSHATIRERRQLVGDGLWIARAGSFKREDPTEA
jgi:hypothetical protein